MESKHAQQRQISLRWEGVSDLSQQPALGTRFGGESMTPLIEWPPSVSDVSESILRLMA